MFNIHLQSLNEAQCICHRLICTTLGTLSLSQHFTLGFVVKDLSTKPVSAIDCLRNLGPITKSLYTSFYFCKVVTTVPVMEVPQAEQIEMWMEYFMEIPWC